MQPQMVDRIDSVIVEENKEESVSNSGKSSSKKDELNVILEVSNQFSSADSFDDAFSMKDEVDRFQQALDDSDDEEECEWSLIDGKHDNSLSGDQEAFSI